MASQLSQALEVRSPDGRYRLVYGQTGPALYRRWLKVLTLMLDDLFEVSDFAEYQLWERGDWHPRFQRRRPRSEMPPQALSVSNAGFCVIRTRWERPEFVVLDLEGHEVLRVPLGKSGLWQPHPEESRLQEGWDRGSWSHFFVHQNRSYFSWRHRAGRHLLLCLGPQPGLVEDQALLQLCQGAEKESLLDLVASQSARIERWLNPPWWNWRNSLSPRRFELLLSLVVLSHAWLLRECLPLLRRLERWKYRAYQQPSPVLGEGGWLRWGLGPLVQLTLRKMGENPVGYLGYQAGQGAIVFSLPFAPPDRPQRLRAVQPQVGPRELLSLVGAPDFARVEETPDGWLETWEYDCRQPDRSWQTTRLQWSQTRALPVEISPSTTAWESRDKHLLQSLGQPLALGRF